MIGRCLGNVVLSLYSFFSVGSVTGENFAAPITQFTTSHKEEDVPVVSLFCRLGTAAAALLSGRLDGWRRKFVFFQRSLIDLSLVCVFQTL